MGLLSFFKKDKRELVKTHIDEEHIKADERLKASVQKSQALESQLARILAIEKEKRDKLKEVDKDSQRNKLLKEQKLDLDAHRHGKVIRLGKFYKDVINGRFKKKPIMVTDKNGEVLLGEFGDFVFMEGGKIGIVEKGGDFLSYGKSLHHALYKPDGFENMIRARQIRIPIDKDGNYTEDIEYKELPEPIDAEFDEETGQLKRIIWSKVKTSEVKKIIAQKMQTIQDLHGELERQDSVMIKMKQQMDDLNRTLKISKNEAYSSQSELSKNIESFSQMRQRMGELHMKLSNLIETKAMYENLLEKKDAVIEKVLVRLETTGNTKFDRMNAQIKDDLIFYKGILPERIEIKQESPEPERPITQPGDIIKR